MANSSRMSSFLPTIKCSMCAQEIEISMMGDHICGTTPEPTPPLEPSANSQSQPNQQPPPNGESYFKPAKLPPPRVDTKAANRPFIRQDQLTPVSASSDSRSPSPMTPYDGKSPLLNVAGGAKPIIQDRLSPDLLAANSDSHFSTLPLPKTPSTSDVPKPQHLPTPQRYPDADPRHAPLSPRTGSNGGLLKRMNTIAPGPFDVRGRRGPKKKSIAAVAETHIPPVPEAPKGHSQNDSTTSSIHSHSSKASSTSEYATIPPISIPKVQRPGGYGGLGSQTDDYVPELLGLGNRSNTFPNISTSAASSLPRRPSEATPSHRRPSNVASDDNELDGSTFVRTSPPREGNRRPSMGIKPPPRGMSLSLSGRNNISSINLAAEFGAGNPYHTPSMSQSSNDSGQSHTSKTSSRSSPPSSVEPHPARMPSNTAGFNNATNDLQEAVSDATAKQMPPSPTQVQYANGIAPPRSLDPSLLSPESPMDPAMQGNRLSPIPPCEPIAENSNRYNSSQQSFPPQQSFPTQQSILPLVRRPSRDDLAQPMSSTQQSFPPQQSIPPLARRPSRDDVSQPMSSTQQSFPPQQSIPPLVRRPSRDDVSQAMPPPGYRPSQSRQDPSQPFPQPLRRPSQPREDLSQGDRRPQPRGNLSPQFPSSQFPPPNRRPSHGNIDPSQPFPPPIRRPTQPRDDPTQQPLRRPSQPRPTTAKGDCKGCHQPITGKSVSSADGRLTGRYHKECFVCRTCAAPFATATFYVINNAPYCERHYHKLNNSCCTACDRGIEGQYLETERRQKFHPGCLTCADCRRVLKDDYFEMNGRVYCERDAFRKAPQRSLLGPGMGGKGTNRMERRTTRLMMI